VFELAAYPNLDDFTVWNNDGPIMVEIELFAVPAVQGRAPGGRKMGTKNFTRASSRASRAAMLGQWKLKPYFSQGWVLGVAIGVIVSFNGRTLKQAPTLLMSQEMAA
jgi:hypothetical protein